MSWIVIEYAGCRPRWCVGRWTGEQMEWAMSPFNSHWVRVFRRRALADRLAEKLNAKGLF